MTIQTKVDSLCVKSRSSGFYVNGVDSSDPSALTKAAALAKKIRALNGYTIPKVIVVSGVTLELKSHLDVSEAGVTLKASSVPEVIDELVAVCENPIDALRLISACLEEQLGNEIITIDISAASVLGQKELDDQSATVGHIALNYLLGKKDSLIAGTISALPGVATKKMTDAIKQLKGVSPSVLLALAVRLTGDLGEGRLRTSMPGHKPLKIIGTYGLALAEMIEQVAMGKMVHPAIFLQGQSVKAPVADKSYIPGSAGNVIHLIMERMKTSSAFLGLNPMFAATTGSRPNFPIRILRYAAVIDLGYDTRADFATTIAQGDVLKSKMTGAHKNLSTKDYEETAKIDTESPTSLVQMLNSFLGDLTMPFETYMSLLNDQDPKPPY